ncbi:helix-turn-helix domain-containing protein [Paenibacillus mesophilus]|uniref:helix-turn-helix transcriptional regulator n=1 Tax=Paenibacillus mesophilus TaxID=2582849 RepID=UPI00110EB97E|nr:AraC family transcriptional regulator [Paenibacillus mesophilus]TMV48643.1 helix-turn-helix domain-containing protein [Paenibacillus mesophilus]
MVIEFIAATNIMIQTRIGSLMFTIHMDATFLCDGSPAMQNQHNHAMSELHFVESGSGLLALSGKEEELIPHTVYLIPSGLYHAFQSDRFTLLRKYTFRFEYSVTDELSDGPPEEAETLKEVLFSKELRRIPNQECLLPLFKRIVRELQERRLGYYTIVQAGFNEILIELMRALTSFSAAPVPTPLPGVDDARSQLIDNYFDQYSSQLTIEHLSGLLHLSTRQTTRVLQQMYKKTFSEKLADIRIEAARKQLAHTKLPVALIAEQLGFTSSSFFCKTFKKRTGTTPQAYRRMNAIRRILE